MRRVFERCSSVATVRRRMKHGFVCLLILVSGCGSVDEPPVDEEERTGLRAAASRRDFAIGAAVETGLASSDPEYSQVLAREFNMLTPGNAMKFGPLRPNRPSFNFGPADQIVDFAVRNEMAVRGHTLVWHSQLPSWVQNGTWSREQLIEILREHITAVVARYKGRVAAWDVVNEAVADNGSLRETIFLETIGPEYIEMAFRWAHEADPDARLFYNDYNAEGMGGKSNAVYALVRDLLEKNVPIHGVGLQMHVSTQFAPPAADVAANIKRLGDLGLEVHVTEMDVRIPLPDTEVKLAQQADVYQTMLEVCLEAWNCTAFVIWGFTDRYSWVPDFFDGYGAALIFDEEYEEKIAYQALKRALDGS